MSTRKYSTSFKAVVATTAGVALLAGAGGSFAQWSDAETVNSAGTVNQGRLSLSSVGGHWESNLNPGVAIADVNTYRVVPGETLTFTDTVTLTAEGDQLDAVLTTNASTVAGEAADNGSLVVSQSVVDSADPLADFGQTVAVDAGDNGREFAIQVNVEFPAAATAQGLSVTLSDIAATVDQNVAA